MSASKGELYASNKEIIEVIKEQIKTEKEAIKMLMNAADKSKNSAVKLLLQCVVYDSMKHEKYCEAIIEMESGKWVVDSEKEGIRKIMTNHIAAERHALDNVKKLEGRLRNQTEIAIVQQIIKDDKRHNDALAELTTNLGYTSTGVGLTNDLLRFLAIDRP